MTNNSAPQDEVVVNIPTARTSSTWKKPLTVAGGFLLGAVTGPVAEAAAMKLGIPSPHHVINGAVNGAIIAPFALSTIRVVDQSDVENMNKAAALLVGTSLGVVAGHIAGKLGTSFDYIEGAAMGAAGTISGLFTPLKRFLPARIDHGLGL